MEISQATIENIPQLSGLLALLFEQEAEFRPDRELQAAGLNRIIESPETGRILVLRDGPKVIGMVNLLYTVSTALGGRVAILEDMVVLPEHRSSGAGSRLLNEAISFAKAEGCLRITLLTDNHNERAKRFYSRHGFIESAMAPMRLLLTP